MEVMAFQITSLPIVYSNVYLGTDQRKHQSSASLAFVRGIHRRPVNSPHKRPVTRKMFPLDDIIMIPADSSHKEPVMRNGFPCRDIVRTASPATFCIHLLTESSWKGNIHYTDVILRAMVYQIGILIVCSTVCSGADHRNQSSASLAFVREIHRRSVHCGKCFNRMTSSWSWNYQFGLISYIDYTCFV